MSAEDATAGGNEVVLLAFSISDGTEPADVPSDVAMDTSYVGRGSCAVAVENASNSVFAAIDCEIGAN